MKEYLFVAVNINEFFGSHCDVHRRIIDEKAQLGYRYVGFVPTDISDYGKIILENHIHPCLVYMDRIRMEQVIEIVLLDLKMTRTLTT